MRALVVAKVLAGACVALLAFMLAFRAFIYSRLYIAPGDPYGISDLIELGIGLLLIVLLGVTAVAAAWLAIRGPRSNRVAAIWVGLTAGAVAILAGPLHSVVARWASS